MKQQHASLILFFCLTLMAACGKKEAGEKPVNTDRSFIRTENYRVVLTNLNSNISGNGAYGTASFKVNDEDLEIQINIIDSHANISHQQILYEKGQCPSLRHDTNADGVIEASEAKSIYGNIFLPLNVEDSVFPHANNSGNYTYTQSFPLSALDSKQGGLEGRVLVIYGVRPESLPQTAATLRTRDSGVNVPIACGILVPIPVEE
jgi:hypothetical protein